MFEVPVELQEIVAKELHKQTAKAVEDPRLQVIVARSLEPTIQMLHDCIPGIETSILGTRP